MGIWTEQAADDSSSGGCVFGVRAVYIDGLTVVTAHVTDGDANSSCPNAQGSAAAAALADALDASGVFNDISVFRSYAGAGAYYTP